MLEVVEGSKSKLGRGFEVQQTRFQLMVVSSREKMNSLIWMILMIVGLGMCDGGACPPESGPFGSIRQLLGMFVARCDSNGSYLEEQCIRAISQCWCVTEVGEEIPGTRIVATGQSSAVADRRDCSSERAKFSMMKEKRQSKKRIMLETASELIVANSSSSDEEAENATMVRPIRQSNTSDVNPAAAGGNGTAAAGGANATSQTSTTQNTTTVIVNGTNPSIAVAGPTIEINQPVIVNNATVGPEPTVVNGSTTAVTTITVSPTTSPRTNQTAPGETTDDVRPLVDRLNRIVEQLGQFLSGQTPGPAVTTVRPTSLAINASTPVIVNSTDGGQSPANRTNPSANETSPGTQNGTRPVVPGDGARNGSCGPNTIYSLCTTSCQPSCDRPEEDLNCQAAAAATSSCTAGCVCAAGYLRRSSNDTRSSTCVRQTACNDEPIIQTPSRQLCQDPNSEWSTCGSPCEETCQFHPSDCPQQCAAGCFCKEGFVKESSQSGATCIPKSSCVQSPQPYQQQCQDPNAALSNCGTACEETCEQPRPVACVRPCVTGCFCRDGYIKQNGSPTARCVPRNQCGGGQQSLQQVDQQQQFFQRQMVAQRFASPPPKPLCTDPNSTWSDCGTSCPETCRMRSSYCTTPCTAGCFCNEGFVKEARARNAKCVPRDSCQQQVRKVSRMNEK